MQSQIRLSGLRIMAMARPCKSRMEILLVCQAIEELKLAGSARARAKSLAQKVADLVVGQFAQDELIASLVRAEVGLGKPAQVPRICATPTPMVFELRCRRR